MRNWLKALALVIFLIAFGLLLFVLAKGHSVPLLDTKGPLAREERNLILTATALMLTVVVPVWMMAAFFGWRYRATNAKAVYRPNWEHNAAEEFIWWAVPCTIVFALAVLSYRSSRDLDPFKPLVSENPHLTIQVIALNWKWLFIYPEQGIASVNFVEFPVATPIKFRITSDAPMNSFWIPQLAGQIYAMPGMETQLHVLASEPGEYRGSSANISGEGFAGMRFLAKAVPQDEFDRWIASSRASQRYLDSFEYDRLTEPTSNVSPYLYGMADQSIFDAAMAKYMTPGSHMPQMHDTD